MPAAFSLLLLAACLPSAWLFQRKALDDYVAKVDPHYSYTVLKKETPFLQGVTVYWLNMTSQKWLDESEVDRAVWSHQLFIVLPKDPTMKDSCLLIPNYGRNDDLSTTGSDYILNDAIELAKSTGSCVALLNQIPNQPITFHKIPLQHCKNALEDDALACTFWRVLNDKTAPPHILLLFPMAKAVVRAMDTTTDFLLKETHAEMNITRFTLAGISKRGWTCWLTAAVDNRIVSFFPIVFDFLNFVKNLHHQYRSYCGWSVGLSFLYNVNLTRQLDDPRFKEIASHIDPLAYNERYYKQSKYITISSGDELFQLDNSNYYFNELKGETLFRIIPNAGHAYIGFAWVRMTLLGPLKAFYVGTMQNLRRPQVSWNRTETNTSGIIHLITDRKPSSIKYYTADSSTISKRRDFRLFFVVVPWFPHSVQEVETGVYKAEVPKPSKGWRGFFIEATFPGPGNNNYVLTSEVNIIPNTFPCEDCHGEGCYGVLM